MNILKKTTRNLIKYGFLAILGGIALIGAPGGNLIATGGHHGGGNDCSDCGGDRDGKIYINADVCKILDLEVKQYQGQGKIESCALFNDYQGTLVAGLKIKSNVKYYVTLEDVYLSKGPLKFPLCPQIDNQGDNNFVDAPVVVPGTGINRKFKWGFFYPTNMSTTKVKLFPDANGDCTKKGNPILSAGYWHGLIKVKLTTS